MKNETLQKTETKSIAVKKKNNRTNEGKIAILFLLPSLIGIFCLNFIPTLISLFVSMTDWRYTQGLGNWNFIGLQNFITLFQEDDFLTALINTVVVTVVVVPVGIFLALVIAALIDNYLSEKSASVVRIALYMPHVCNIVAVCTVWRALYSSKGPFTNLVRALGVENPPTWLFSYKWSLIAVMLVMVWAGIGHKVMLYGASMAGLPTDVYESAELDGANGRQQFFKITMPLLSNTTFYLFITGMIGSFQTFGYVNVMTGGGPGNSTYVLVYYIYKLNFDYYESGKASAVAVILFLILLAITILRYSHNNKKD